MVNYWKSQIGKNLKYKLFTYLFQSQRSILYGGLLEKVIKFLNLDDIGTLEKF